MKFLYGVQATGNGHITRAYALQKQFAKYNLDVDFVFSGRPRDAFFDMDTFGDWRCLKGLTFVTEKGKLKLWDTVRYADLKSLWQDINTLDVSPYEVVISDFEPITAWAAKKQGKPCIGLGHQYAFHHKVPAHRTWSPGYQLMRHFAPCDIGLGLHWHHFDQAILPPIVDTLPAQTCSSTTQVEANKVLVYFGFEEQADILNLLEPFTEYEFVYYGRFSHEQRFGHITLKPFSRAGFQKDLATAAYVASNAGFELASEAIHLGKKLLVKPVAGQVEQLSNAKAMDQLGLGMTMQSLNGDTMRDWLSHWQAKPVHYPNVAEAIVRWLPKGQWTLQSRAELVKSLWQGYDIENPMHRTQPAAAL